MFHILFFAVATTGPSNGVGDLVAVNNTGGPTAMVFYLAGGSLVVGVVLLWWLTSCRRGK